MLLADKSLHMGKDDLVSGMGKEARWKERGIGKGGQRTYPKSAWEGEREKERSLWKFLKVVPSVHFVLYVHRLLILHHMRKE